MRLLLKSAADPDSALDYLERFYRQSHDTFSRLVADDAAVQSLIAVFSHSQFLSEKLLQYPEWLESLLRCGDLYRQLTTEEIETQFMAVPREGLIEPLDLATFRRRQLLRILLRDVRGLASVSETTLELSNLADALLKISYHRVRNELIHRYGRPMFHLVDGTVAECGFAVIALGKLGGHELNYSSDIDLMFLYSANGETDGTNSISNAEFFKRLANAYTELLSTYTSEGFCYRVDLRLRPDGRLGEACLSLDGTKEYYSKRGRDWELQMLIKARVAAGERELGANLLEFVQPLIYTTTLDFSAVEQVWATRLRQSEQLARRRGASGEFDVKLSRGGIRDIEFLVQCLQRLHGGREPWVRHGGTLQALARLLDKDLLSSIEYSRLAMAYQFLRNLEHRLQYWGDSQTHSLPRDSMLLSVYAARMPASQIGGVVSGEGLLRDLNLHLEEVQEIYERVIHAQQPMYYTITAMPVSAEQPEEAPVSNLVRFLDQKAPKLAASINGRQLKRGFRHLDHFLEKVLNQPEWLNALNQDPLLTSYVLDIFESSPYLSEHLIRTPDLLEELFRFGAGLSFRETFSDPVLLRRFYRREMFRIEAESVCLCQPVFHTLDRTSELTEFAIDCAYKSAVQQVMNALPPVSQKYVPRDQMMVIALGRLGMREFDLGSDADLVFVLPDRDAPEVLYWSRVAERLTDIVSAYTGEGTLFAVDTRLRPSGRDGDLVQLESAYLDYFAKHAQAWEGITYMKARGVAGNIESATAFLNRLQDVDWRAYGQSGRSRRELRKMRLRLEKEQSHNSPLKAGPGGYYDIDFALMYLRLKGAGIFFKLLNTPARIDVIEKMGHLDRQDAQFLRDAATFYRAVDHALRLSSGHAEGSLPRSLGQLEILTELVARWVPPHLSDQPLLTEYSQIQHRTREFFNRLFPIG